MRSRKSSPEADATARIAALRQTIAVLEAQEAALLAEITTLAAAFDAMQERLRRRNRLWVVPPARKEGTEGVEE